MSTAIQGTLASLSSFDWFLVCVVALSAAMAFRRGMIKVLFSFAGVAAGLLLAGWYCLPAAAWLHAWIASATVAKMIAFAAILGMAMIVCSLAARVLGRTAKAVGLGMFDRLLGGVFGAARGMLLGVAVVLAMAAFVPRSTWLRNSRLAPYFLTGAHAVSFLMPRQLKQQVAAGSASPWRQSLVSSRFRRD